MLFEPEAQQVLERGGLFKLIKLTEQWDKKYPKETIFNSLLAISKGVEIFIASPLVMTVTYCLAELNKAVWIPIVLGPTYPTMEFPIWPLENLIISSCMNKYSYNLVYKMLWNSEKEMVNTWRTKTLGLKPIGNRRGIADVIDKLAVPVVVASSVLVLKKQRRPLDYPENISFTGFIMVPDAPEESVREDLVEFISDDPMATRLSHITTSSAASALHTTFRINDKSNPIVSATDDNTTSALHTEEEMNDGTVSEGVTIDDLHDEERAKKKVTFGGVFVEIRPIIYLGFGSMPSTKPLALIQLAIDVSKFLDTV